MTTIKIGVFGIGGRGKTFYDNIRANGGQVVAVCDKGVKKEALQGLLFYIYSATYTVPRRVILARSSS